MEPKLVRDSLPPQYGTVKEAQRVGMKDQTTSARLRVSEIRRVAFYAGFV
jgi:hypothetical protein